MPNPLDLARCRALAGEAERRATSDRSMMENVWLHEVATALHAACDEVERLREAHGARHAELPPVDWETNGGIEP